MAPAKEKPLDPVSLQEALRGQWIGSRILVLEQTSSTNDEAFRLGLEGAEEGLVIFAEHQTAGRGRHGNRWESCAGKGLWFSLLLRPALSLSAATRLTNWAAGGIVAAIDHETGVAARIKPPNDVFVADRKVAGVLVELRAQPRQPHLAIVGIGINVNQRAEDFSASLQEKATSLALVRNETIDREGLAICLLRQLQTTYDAILAP